MPQSPSVSSRGVIEPVLHGSPWSFSKAEMLCQHKTLLHYIRIIIIHGNSHNPRKTYLVL